MFIRADVGRFCCSLHDVFGCPFRNIAFSTDGVYCATYYVQRVLELRVMSISQTTHRICSFHDNFILLCGQSFILSRDTTGELFHGRFSPSGSPPNCGLRRVVVGRIGDWLRLPFRLVRHPSPSSQHRSGLDTR